MKSFKKHILLLVLIALAALPLLAAPADPARHAWMGGYEAMTHAEQEEKDNAELAALRHYEQALKIFEQVHYDYPDWNVSIITYRIEYCRKKIADIKEKNRQNTAFLSREDLINQLATAATELQSAKERSTLLETQLKESREALQRARAEAAANAANEENIRILKGDREILNAQVQKLTTQLAAAQEDLRQSQAAAQDRTEVEEVKRQLDATRKELEQTSRLLEQTGAARDALLQQTQREAQWHKMATDQIDALRAQLAATQQQLDEATAQLQDLRQTLQLQNASPETLAAIVDENATPAQLRAKLGAREGELKNAQMELLNLRRKLLQAEETAEGQLAELTDLKRRFAANNQLVNQEIAKAAASQQEKEGLQQQLQELQQTTQSQRDLLARLEEAAGNNERRAAGAEAKVLALQAQLEAATKAAQGINANAEDMEENLRRSQAETAALKQQLEQTGQALATAQETVRAQQERIDELMKNAQANESVKAAEKVWMAQVQELRDELETSSRKQHDLEVALIKRENEKNALAAALQEREKQDRQTAPPAPAEQQPQPQTQDDEVLTATTGQPATLLSRQSAIILRGYLRQGVDAERAGKREAAQWNYEQALEIQPENPTALKRLGVLAYQRNDFQEASRYLNAAFRTNPDDHDILLALGFTMLQLNQPQWALAYLARANALKPADFQTAKLFGNALSAMKWRASAMRQLAKALEIQPTDAETAMTLAMLQMTEASETELAARKDPTHQEALHRLAAAQRKQALEWYRKAVANGAQPDPKLEEELQK